MFHCHSSSQIVRHVHHGNRHQSDGALVRRVEQLRGAPDATVIVVRYTGQGRDRKHT